VVPLFLAQVRGFSALQIGETVVVVGLAQLVLSPFAPRIARHLDLRVMLSMASPCLPSRCT
jgi:DHA2 family multidrug resistance protein